MYTSSFITAMCLITGHLVAAAPSSSAKHQDTTTTTYVSMMDAYGPNNCDGLPYAPLNLPQAEAGECMPFGSSFGAVKLKYLEEGCTVTLYEKKGCKGASATVDQDECKASTVDVTYAYYKTTCA